MKLDPNTVGNRLNNLGFNPDVVDEIVTAIRVKNDLDDFKEKKGYEKGYNFED